MIHTRRTFDQAREAPRVCACGLHHVAGEWTRLHCPWPPVLLRGKWGAYWGQAEYAPLWE